MNNKIQAIPLNGKGDLLFLRNFEQKKDKFFIEYRAMINDVPFQKVQIWLIDGNKNFVITGDDGTVMYRFPVQAALNVMVDEQVPEVSK